MGWILIPQLSEKCKKFINDNPNLKLSKFVYRNGSFVFYRKYITDTKAEYEASEFRITLVKNEEGKEGWAVSYMRHTGKWHPLPIFGNFDYCFREINGGKCGVLMPLK